MLCYLLNLLNFLHQIYWILIHTRYSQSFVSHKDTFFIECIEFSYIGSLQVSWGGKRPGQPPKLDEFAQNNNSPLFSGQ